MGDNRSSVTPSSTGVGVGVASFVSDTQELLDPVLDSNADGSFKSLKTVPAFR